MINKVVHLQYNLTSAGKQPLRLHHALLQAGIDSSLLSLNSNQKGDDKILGLGNSYRIISRIDKKLQDRLTRKRNPSYGLFSYPVLGSNVSNLDQVRSADAIYLHWFLNGFLSLRSIEQLARLKKPVIFFLHDMWSITGGCHYSFECKKYEAVCSNCQVFPDNNKNDLAMKEFQKKMKLYSKYDNFYFVAPSKWIYECAKQSMLTKNKPIFYIPNLVDNKLYKPFDKAIAKKILNIRDDEIIISFGAVSVNSPYKGWTFLKRALEVLSKKNDFGKISVLVFGSEYNKKVDEMIPFDTRFMGYIHDDYTMALVYNASDVFIAPSTAEAFGVVILESLCCGTPVVAFDVGGIPDLISHKSNGYLAQYKDPNDLVNGIRFCIENNIKGQMLPVFEPSNTIQKHLELFKYIDQNH